MGVERFALYIEIDYDKANQSCGRSQRDKDLAKILS